MNNEANNMTCADFQGQLPDLIATGQTVSGHPHLQECELCQALLADPNASSTLTPEQLWELCDQLTQAHRALLPRDLGGELELVLP